jgi:hypothetical protein
MRTPPFLLASLLVGIVALPAQAQVLLHTLASPTPETDGAFGWSVSGVPDLDGDGVMDLFVGAYREDAGSIGDEGKAYVYSGASGVLLHTLISPDPQGGAWFGRAVAGVEDTDGDGRGDLLVGVEFENHGGLSSAGRAYVFSGASGALTHTLVSPNAQTAGHFGGAVSGVPDVNGDGRSELLVAAPFEASSAGRVYLYDGATGTPYRMMVSPHPSGGDRFGWSLAGVPDVNGDGRADILVGAPYESSISGQGWAGQAYVFSGHNGTLLHTLTSPKEEYDGRFGDSVSGVSDVDGDGRGDLLVGAPNEDGGAEDAGRAYLFSGATGTLLYALASPNAERWGRFGNALSGVPDVDGDGRGDLLLGVRWEQPDASGRTYVFSGRSGAPLRTLESPNASYAGYFGNAVAGVQDVDGDERGDLLIGASGEDSAGVSDAGRVYLFSGASPPLVQLTLSATALNSPVTKPGHLRFGVSLTNLTPSPLRGDLCLEVVAPDATTYSRLIEDNRTLGGSRTTIRRYAVGVGASAPLGTYHATVSALGDGGTVAASTDFTFEVVALEALIPREVTEAGVLGEVMVLNGAAGPGSAGPDVLVEVFPNPAIDQITLALGLAEPAEVRVSIHNVLGREVAVVHERPLAAGRHEVAFDGTRLPAGVYVVRVEAEGAVAVRTVTLVQ